MTTHRAVPFEFKTLSAEGTFEGLAAVYGVQDEQGDVFDAGCFGKHLAAHGSAVPILWANDAMTPIGFGDVFETADGLWLVGALNLETRRGREALALMRQFNAVDMPFGLSIGFQAVQSDFRGSVRHITEARLWEVSPTIFPAQSLAVVSGVKSTAADRERVRADLARMRAEAKALLEALRFRPGPEVGFALYHQGRSPDQRRTLHLQLAAAAQAHDPDRQEVLERFLAQLDNLEARLSAASRP